MPFANRSEIALYYEVFGDGPPICLINGYRLSGMAWPHAFIARLSARCSVIVFDNRGTGRSDKPNAGYEFPTLAKDVVHCWMISGSIARICSAFRWGARSPRRSPSGMAAGSIA